MIFEWIHRHRGVFDLAVMCEIHCVSRAGYYTWRDRKPSSRDAYRAQVIESIRRIHVESDSSYGSPRIHDKLIKQGESINRKTVEKYMKAAEIRGNSPARFVPTTTDSDHDRPVAENVLDRDFSADAPDRKWAGDITYVWTAEGWLYVAVIMDLFSRRIVGWAMADHMRSELCEEALSMALRRRRPEAGLIHHSDRGSQYVSDDYKRIVGDHEMVPSMSRRANCWDNAVTESFWSTLKREHVYRRRFATRAEARSSIFTWIEGWYNRRRSHSAIGYMSPEAFEASRN